MTLEQRIKSVLGDLIFQNIITIHELEGLKEKTERADGKNEDKHKDSN